VAINSMRPNLDMEAARTAPLLNAAVRKNTRRLVPLLAREVAPVVWTVFPLR
jgi:hypothetical protein